MHPFEGEREKAEKNGTKSEWRKNIENHKRFEFSVAFLFFGRSRYWFGIKQTGSMMMMLLLFVCYFLFVHTMKIVFNRFLAP